MLWFNRPKTASAWDEQSTLFEKRMMAEVRPFVESGQLDDYQLEDEAWTVVGTRGVIWAKKEPDPYSPMRNFPTFNLVVDIDGVSSIVESGDVATLIQKAKVEYPTEAGRQA